MAEHHRHHVEIKVGERVVTSAEVDTPNLPGTVHASLHAVAGHLPPGSRGSLVDAVLDLPEVRGNRRLEVTVPLGDAESLLRIQERCADMTTRAAGASALVEAVLPKAGSR